MKSMQRFGGVLLAAWLVTIGTGAPASAGDKVDLKYRLKVGKRYSFKFRSDEKVTYSFGGQQQTVEKTWGLGISMHPKKVNDDGDMTILVRFDSAMMKMKSLAGGVDYDSEKPPSRATDPAAKGIAAMVGKTFTITMRPTGEITDVKEAEVLLESVLKDLALPEGPMKALAVETLRSVFGPEAIKQSLTGAGSAVFPEKPVAVGNSWSRKHEVNAGLAMTFDTTWKLKSVRNDAATIAVSSKVTTDPRKTIDMAMMKVTCELSGEEEGTQVINLKSGWVKEATFHQTLKGTMKMVGLSGNGGDMGVPMTIDSKATVKSVKSGKTGKTPETGESSRTDEGSKAGKGPKTGKGAKTGEGG